MCNDKYIKTMTGNTKAMKMRGKYRSMTTTLGDVKFNACLWADSTLIATVSADLGTQAQTCKRRCGRHVATVACPDMVYQRGIHFRAVDQNDQLRLGKWHFDFISRKKPWHKVFFALIELLIVNIYIIAKGTIPDLTQPTFRWKLVLALVKKANEMEQADAETQKEAEAVVPLVDDGDLVGRWNGGKDTHHHDRQPDYIFPHEVASHVRVYKILVF